MNRRNGQMGIHGGLSRNDNNIDLSTAYRQSDYYVNMIDHNVANEEVLLRLAIENFYFGYRAFTAPPDRVLAQRGLGRVHHRILYFVGRNPRISVNALLALLFVSKQALNAPLRQLVEMGLVAMATAEHDRRVRELTLTANGAKLEAQLTGTQMKQLHEVFAQAGQDAKSGWMQVMTTLGRQS